jgi:hypothetical protein
MGSWYTTRESVKRALDSAETARNNGQVDQAIDSASRSVEGLTHRIFRPVLATRYFDWPDLQRGRPWRLWLNGSELISLTSLTAGGTTIPNTNLLLEPANYGPPFDSIETNIGSTSAFTLANTHQRAIAVTGLFGYSNDEAAAGTLAAAITTVGQTSVNVSDSSLIGVGDVLRVDQERVVVIGKQMLTTGQTLQTPVAASSSDVTVAVTSGAGYAVDEVLLLDAERMLIVDIAGNNLIVKRAWDGSVLAAHTGSTIYAARTLAVTRAALGTTAATHLNSAPISRHEVPGLVRQLTIAEALNDLLQGQGGYARIQRAEGAQQSGFGDGLNDIRERCEARYARKARTAAI